MRGTTLVHTQSILSPVSPPVLGMHKRPKIILFYTLRPNEVRIFKRPLYLSRTMGLTGLSWTEFGSEGGFHSERRQKPRSEFSSLNSISAAKVQAEFDPAPGGI